MICQKAFESENSGAQWSETLFFLRFLCKNVAKLHALNKQSLIYFTKEFDDGNKIKRMHNLQPNL